MPPELNAELFTQLGIAGAALFILLVYTVLLFKFFTKFNSGETKSIDRLCVKIDALVTSYSENTSKLNEVLLSNDKDQKMTLKLLDRILNCVEDMQRRVSRIDDRTFGCLRTHGREENIDEKQKGA